MVASSYSSLSSPYFQVPSTIVRTGENLHHPQRQNLIQIGCSRNRPEPVSTKIHCSSSSSSSNQARQRSVAVAASVALLLWSNPAKAGFLSGLPGIESVPGPQLPQIDFLTKFNEENQKKYQEYDERFKSSPLLKKLLEQSKLNREKNRQAIQDKYCIRGAEWGVGDCSTDGMTAEEKDKFIAMLKEKAGVKE